MRGPRRGSTRVGAVRQGVPDPARRAGLTRAPGCPGYRRRHPLVVFRWYDAVVLGAAGDQVRMWEPTHGEILATPRHFQQRRQRGTRAYLSAGLPGADWWVAGYAATTAEQADAELGEVERFCTKHDLWDKLS